MFKMNGLSLEMANAKANKLAVKNMVFYLFLILGPILRFILHNFTPRSTQPKFFPSLVTFIHSCVREIPLGEPLQTCSVF